MEPVPAFPTLEPELLPSLPQVVTLRQLVEIGANHRAAPEVLKVIEIIFEDPFEIGHYEVSTVDGRFVRSSFSAWTLLVARIKLTRMEKREFLSTLLRAVRSITATCV